MVANIQITEDQTDRMIDLIATKALEQLGQKNTPTSLTPVGPYAHGPGGLFAPPSQDDQVFSALIAPLGGVGEQFPVFDGATSSGGIFGGDEGEFYTIITGVTQGAAESFSNQPTTACADGARAGLMKVCTIANPEGRYRFSPNAPVDIQRAGLRAEIAEPTSLRIMNLPSNVGQGPLNFNLGGANPLNSIINEFVKRTLEMAISMQRFFAEEVFVANPSSNSGEAKRFTGLDLLINENNKVDFESSSVCTAANSDMKNFGFDLVDGAGRDIMEYLEQMYDYLNWISVQSGLGMWDGMIAMRPELFNILVGVVPVRAYQEMLNQMANFNNGRVTVDGRQALDFRNDMFNNQYLPLRGRRVPVVLDTGIAEDDVTTQASLAMGQYASDIYFIPLRAMGVPVTYWRLFNFNNLQLNTLVRMLQVSEAWTTDGGYFHWNRNYKNGCLDWNVTLKPRLVMRTPYTAGRIQNVAYEPLQHLRSHDPDSNYFFDGGRTNSAEQTYYTEWSTTTPVQL